MLATVNWKLTLVLAVVIPIFIFFTQKQRANMLRANVEVKKKTAEINAAIESSISGIRTAKAFVNEHAEEDKFRRSNDKFKTAKPITIRRWACFTAAWNLRWASCR